MKLFLAFLFFGSLTCVQALAAGAYTCNTTCGYGPYKCLTNELRRTYTVAFSHDERSVTVSGGGGLSGTYATRKVGVYQDLVWSQPWSGSNHPISYRFGSYTKDLHVEITTEKREGNGITFLTNYYRGFCK